MGEGPEERRRGQGHALGFQASPPPPGAAPFLQLLHIRFSGEIFGFCFDSFTKGKQIKK